MLVPISPKPPYAGREATEAAGLLVLMFSASAKRPSRVGSVMITEKEETARLRVASIVLECTTVQREKLATEKE